MKNSSFSEGVALPWWVTAILSILCVYLLHDRSQIHARLASFERSHAETVASGQKSIQTDEKLRLMAESTACSNSKNGSDVDDIKFFSREFSQSSALLKFSLLFSDLNLSTGSKQQLSSMLAQRERILAQPVANQYMHASSVESNVEAQQEALDHIENNIKALLGPVASDTFDLLKYSDSEQQQLIELTTRLEAVAPITDEQKKTLLLSKLTHKRGFEDTLATYKNHTNNADESDRKVAFKVISESLRRYRDGYLEEAVQYVDEQQLAGLMDYEAIQFEEIEASLRTGLQID
jgi:hypothetical protein